MDEQEGMAEESARRDPRKLSAVWIAKGDHLVLLVTKAIGLKAKKTRYTCPDSDGQFRSVVDENRKLVPEFRHRVGTSRLCLREHFAGGLEPS